MKALNEQPETEIFIRMRTRCPWTGISSFSLTSNRIFNLDLLCTVNYICHLFVARRSVIEKAGVLRPEFDGAQDYDFIFRCIEGERQDLPHSKRSFITGAAMRTPHRRIRRASCMRLTPVSVPCRHITTGWESARRCLKGEYLGLYRTRFLRDYDPLISIIIPNKDHTEDLDRCIQSIEEKSTYKNYEYIIVENNSTEEETFEYYKSWNSKTPELM